MKTIFNRLYLGVFQSGSYPASLEELAAILAVERLVTPAWFDATMTTTGRLRYDGAGNLQRIHKELRWPAKR